MWGYFGCGTGVSPDQRFHCMTQRESGHSLLYIRGVASIYAGTQLRTPEILYI